MAGGGHFGCPKSVSIAFLVAAVVAAAVAAAVVDAVTKT